MAKSGAFAAESIGLFVLRAVFGTLMVVEHGWGKLMSYSERAQTFPDPLGVGHQMSLNLALFGEIVAPALLVLGLATRVVAIPAAFTMGVAFFVVHAGDPLGDRELALAYLSVFTALVFTGAGGISLDGMLQKSMPGWMRVVVGQPR